MAEIESIHIKHMQILGGVQVEYEKKMKIRMKRNLQGIAYS
jgi:hypothetical protein